MNPTSVAEIKQEKGSRLFILFTHEEGGEFFLVPYLAMHNDTETRKLYEETCSTGWLLFQVGDKVVKLKPSYICLGKAEEDFDFIMGKSRIKPGMKS